MILFFIALLAGVLTVLAPCTISLLPVIVGGSVGGGHSFKRALVVTTSLGLSVVLFTLILKVSTAFINIPQEFWQMLSGVIIFLLGATMIFPSLYERLPGINKLNQGSNKLLATGYNKQNFAGDVIIGAALGPVFSSCSPTYFLILATVLPRSLGAGIIYLFAYAFGLSAALLVVSFAGQKLLEKLGAASDPNGWVKRCVGILFLLVGIGIFLGYDKKLETSITNAGYFDVTSIEQKLLTKELPASGGVAPAKNANGTDSTGATNPQLAPSAPVIADAKTRIALKSLEYSRAPEITDPSGFVNTNGQPIKISDYIGKKVILIDFWTYSCINCQRTLPYLKAWNDKYASQGLQIISIHTPEFAFEKVLANVQKAVDGFGLKYPVVLDNDYGTWNAFGSHYWPNKYLIDIDGFVVYNHAGEGNYDITEAEIQKLLAERNMVLGDNTKVSGGTVAPANVVSVDGAIGSPETYFGSNRNEYLANGAQGTAGNQTLAVPSTINLNSLYLGGTWNFNPEYAQSNAVGDTVVYKYSSKNVYFVASSATGTRVRITIDGNPIGSMAGADVGPDGIVNIKDNRLYHLVSGSDYSAHTLKIETLDPGLDAYTFTFG